VVRVFSVVLWSAFSFSYLGSSAVEKSARLVSVPCLVGAVCGGRVFGISGRSAGNLTVRVR
jgi:hypothetical protein